MIKLKHFAQVEGNEAQSKIMLAKLDKMSRFCETKTCRRKYLLNYFGEAAPDFCDSCDTCLNRPVLQDCTVIAQKILSTVARVNQRFGAKYIVDIIRGSNNEKIKEEHKSLKVYGIGKDKSKEEWMHYTKELIHYQYLNLSDGQYPVVQLGDKSKGALYQNEKVYLSAPVSIEIAREPEIYQQHPYEKDLFERLKSLRNKIAHEENVPAYIIFSDSTLMDLATYLPVMQKDLARISGFGAYKIEKYGSAFLELVQDYCLAHKLETKIELKQAKRERKQSSGIDRPSDTKRLTYAMYKGGKSISEIARERKVSDHTIETHLSYYISNGELEIDEFVEKQKQQAIKKAIEMFGSLSLKVLKENLPEEISYGEIRMVLAENRNT